jgi:hypothetical protein
MPHPKERKVLDHLPEREPPSVRPAAQAWANPDAAAAQRDLEALGRQLDKVNLDAVGSLLEGLAEVFTVTRLVSPVRCCEPCPPPTRSSL